MAPLLTKAEYTNRPFFDIAPSSMHIRDLIHEETHYDDRTSDLITGMLLLAVHEKIITKVEACWFAVPFTIGAKLRTSVYQHEGNPFLGPDGRPMSIVGKFFHGSGGPAQNSQYTFDTMKNAPNFDRWLAQTLFRSTNKDDSDFSRNNQTPPKRKMNGARISTPGSAALGPSFSAGPSSSAVPATSSSRKRARSGKSSTSKEHQTSKDKKYNRSKRPKKPKSTAYGKPLTSPSNSCNNRLV